MTALKSLSINKLLLSKDRIFFSIFDLTEESGLFYSTNYGLTWKKSKLNPESKESTHSLYTEDMCKRTVINKICKYYINTKDDSNLNMIKQAFETSDEELKENEVEYEIQEKSNKEVIDIDGYINELSFEKKLYEIKRLLKIYIPMLNINFPFDNMDVMLLNDKEEVHFTTLNKSDFKEDINYLSQEELITKDEKTLKLTNI